MRKLDLIAIGTVAASFPNAALAETKTVEAYCELPQKKLVTNVVTVTINIDTSSGDPYRIAKYMAEAIAYKASDTLYKMGINSEGEIYCRFSDPNLTYYVNENKPLDYLRQLPGNDVGLGYKLVSVNGFGIDPPPSYQSSATTVAAKEPNKFSTTSAPAQTGETDDELRYQRELAAYNARLAEIEQIKADIAAKHAANVAAAAKELAQHRAEVAVAEAARSKYERDLAAHQQLVGELETKQDRDTKVDWREALVVCTLDPANGQSKFGNWRCDGPLQFTYAKLGAAGAGLSAGSLTALSQACGGDREAIRDLGLVNGYRVFGCSFGLHPNNHDSFPLDAAAKYGLNYVDGRAIYRCPAWKSYCRTK